MTTTMRTWGASDPASGNSVRTQAFAGKIELAIASSDRIVSRKGPLHVKKTQRMKGDGFERGQKSSDELTEEEILYGARSWKRRSSTRSGHVKRSARSASLAQVRSCIVFEQHQIVQLKQVEMGGIMGNLDTPYVW